MTRDSEGPGLNPDLEHLYFSHPVTFGAETTHGTDRLTPARKRLGVIFEGDNHLRGRNVRVRPVQIPVPDNSIGRAPDKGFRGPGMESWSFLSLFIPLQLYITMVTISIIPNKDVKSVS